MALPRELHPFTVTRGDFLYKTATEAEWTRLPSPVESWKTNCSGITFDNGVILMQKHREHGSVCQLKLILSPPLLTTEDDQIALEAACVEMGNPTFTAITGYKDKAAAVEHARSLPLAHLDRTLTAVKLRYLSESARRGTQIPADHELGERIWALIDRGYRARAAAKAKKLWTVQVRPRPPSGSNGGDDSTDAFTRLRERLQAHRVATEQGEVKLRQRLEDDRQAVLKAVAGAINAEWERKVAAAVAEFRAQATAAMERIVAKGKV